MIDLKMPGLTDSNDKKQAWRDLTGEFFSSILEAVRNKERLDFEALHKDLNSWRPFIEDQSEEGRYGYERQWNYAKCLLWCAQNKNLSPPSDDIEDSLFSLSNTLNSNTPDSIKGREGWVLDCIRIFGKKEAVKKVVEVPVALCLELPRTTGTIAVLILELIENGQGRIFQHPRDTVETYLDSRFEESMRVAFEAALDLALQNAKGEIEGKVDGRWRLVAKDGKAYRQVGGDSASGAAALGWYYALMNYVIDNRLIVLANIDSKGNFGEVLVKAKVKAVWGDTRYKFDKIIVATPALKLEVKAELEGFNTKGIEVKTIAKLEYAVKERSQLADEVLCYFKQVVEKAGEGA